MLFCMMLFVLGGQAQDLQNEAYQPLFEDTTGLRPSREVAQKASQLRAGFPRQLQNQFKVFSTSSRILKQHIPDARERTIISRSLKDTFPYESPYYLSFFWVRPISYKPIRAYVDVYVKLPHEGPFRCISTLERYAISGGLMEYVKSLVPKDRDFTDFEKVELAVMDSLQKLVRNLNRCCRRTGKNKCDNCLSANQITGAFNEFNNQVSHVSKYPNANGYVKHNARTQRFSGVNYRITEIEPVYTKWEGTDIRLSKLLIEYFTTRAKGVFWETIILPSKICKTLYKDALQEFIEKGGEAILAEAQPVKKPDYTHKLLVTISEEGNLLLKISTEDEMFHPINLKSIKPVLIGQ